MNNTISVIVPVYNSEIYLSKCLESILNQTYLDMEIICIDDQSTDQSLEVLQRYARIDSRIKVIQKINEGVSLARNKGLEIASGKYVLFVDSDDWIERDTCEQAVKKIENENADVVMWPYVREREGESKNKQIFDRDIIFLKQDVLEKLHRRMIGIVDKELAQPENADALCTVWGKLYRRSIITDNHIRFYDIREIGTYEDGLFNLFYFWYVQKAVFLNQYFYHYRRTNIDSVTEIYNEHMGKQWEKLFRIMTTYIKQNSFGQVYKEALQNRISLSLIPLGINEMNQKCSAGCKMKNLKRIISKREYQICVKKLKTGYMPTHWKIFFGAARTKNAFIVFVLLYVIQKIRGK